MNPVNFGTVCSKSGTGSGTGQLTTSYTRGDPIAHVGGMYVLSFACSVTITAVTSIEYRVMDYRDPAKPRLLQSIKMTDPAKTNGEQQSTVSENFILDVEVDGAIDGVALEAKSTGGVLGAGDIITATLLGQPVAS